MKNIEVVYGSYGTSCIRSENRSIWDCSNSDYMWQAIIDDFGDLVAISNYINIRGY